MRGGDSIVQREEVEKGTVGRMEIQVGRQLSGVRRKLKRGEKKIERRGKRGGEREEGGRDGGEREGRKEVRKETVGGKRG